MPERTGETIPTRADLTRERILEAAEAAFARRGLSGTRVREIAAAAQVTAAALYTYFPSKSGLYKAVLERGLQPLLAIMTESSDGPGGPEAGSRVDVTPAQRQAPGGVASTIPSPMGRGRQTLVPGGLRPPSRQGERICGGPRSSWKFERGAS